MPEFFAFAELSDPQSPLFPQNFVSSDQDIYQTRVLSTVVGIAMKKVANLWTQYSSVTQGAIAHKHLFL